MVNLEQRIESLYNLGLWLDLYFNPVSESLSGEFDHLEKTIQNTHIYNQWFIAPFNRNAFNDFRKLLTEERIVFFKTSLDALIKEFPEKKIAVLPSQNIPFGGALELILLYIAGFKVILRNNDHKNDLLHFVTQKLISINPGISEYIQWIDNYPKDTDAWIIHDKPGHMALHTYFRKRKSLFLSPDRSFAVISGNETSEELIKIADRIFIYWGFSPDNIRKVFVPEGYSFNQLFEALEKYNFLYQYNCYANNYDYHKSVLLMNQIPFLDNGFILLREDPSVNVPIGCLYYEYYATYEKANELAELADKLSAQRTEKTALLIVEFIKTI